MTQLTLQFEGYADEVRQPVDVSATTQRTVEAASQWLQRENKTCSEIAGTSISNLLVIRAALATAFSFSVVWFSILIGG